MVFRREMPQADDLWERAREIYAPLGAKFNETSKSVRFKPGGRLRLRPLERVSDAEKYQGQNLTAKDHAVEGAAVALPRRWRAVRRRVDLITAP